MEKFAKESRFSRLVLVCVLFFCVACGNVPNSNQSQSPTTPAPFVSPAPAPEATPRPFDANLDIGLVIPGSECSELFIRNKELKPGDEIQVVSVEERPHKKLMARVIGPNNCIRPPQSTLGKIVVNDVDTEPDQYEIRFEDPSESTFGFGVVSATASVEIVKGTAQFVSSDGSTPLFFRDCSGNESYHMTVWEGKPLVGKRIWHSYITLRYDTVPTCKPADYR